LPAILINQHLTYRFSNVNRSNTRLHSIEIFGLCMGEVIALCNLNSIAECRDASLFELQ
jgi:hypothetical protein